METQNVTNVAPEGFELAVVYVKRGGQDIYQYKFLRYAIEISTV